MALATNTALRGLTATGVEAVTLGLVAGGCRLAFAAPGAHEAARGELRRLERRLDRLGGALIQADSDPAAALMAAGAAMSGARAAALVADSAAADGVLSGLDDLCPVLVDVSGKLPVYLPHARSVVAPHTPQAAYDAARGAFARTQALHGPAVIAGLQCGLAEFQPVLGEADPVLPIHHDGPDDPDMLLLGAGPGFAVCAEARERLEEQGVSAAHLHLLQLAPFPGALIAPAITSARRVLVVEPGGPGSLAALVRAHLGAPSAPFGELHRLAGAPLGPDEVAGRVREVMAL